MTQTAILAAREQRSREKKRLLTQWPIVTSLSFNLPGLPKSTALTRAAFAEVTRTLDQYFCAQRCSLRQQPIVHDAAGDHVLWAGVPLYDAIALKALTERFEGDHPLGRLLDVDIYTPEGPIRSGKYKRCLICNEPALICMRTQKHSLETLRAFCDQRLSRWWATQQRAHQCRTLSSSMTRALLEEVLLTPKPGLVDQQDSGSHHDMDLSCFIQAISALAPFWEHIAALGQTFDGKHWQDALITLRRQGLKMEMAMQQATNGINTHKGAIFLGCLAVFACAYVQCTYPHPQRENYRHVIRTLSHDLIARDLQMLDSGGSYGQRLLHDHQDATVGGPRYQAEQGFPGVFEKGLPALEAALDKGIPPSAAHLHTLLVLMAHVLDTNVLHRSSLETAHHFMALAKQATCSLLPEANIIDSLNTFCRQHWISAGGCADLLTMTLFFHYADASVIPHDSSQ